MWILIKDMAIDVVITCAGSGIDVWGNDAAGGGRGVRTGTIFVAVLTDVNGRCQFWQFVRCFELESGWFWSGRKITKIDPRARKLQQFLARILTAVEDIFDSSTLFRSRKCTESRNWKLKYF